ncbi:MAG: FliH/SctL family protein [Myxococcales bacterium]
MRTVRIVRAASSSSAPLFSEQSRRRLTAEEVHAHEQAKSIVADALEKAATLLDDARAQALVLADKAAKQAREHEVAKFAASYLALRRMEEQMWEQMCEQRLEGTIPLAVLLAERLLREALRLEPERVMTLARAALSEARGARTIVIEAHADDVAVLQRALGDAAFSTNVVAVHAAQDLSRGDLRLRTDIGLVHAQLTPQIERLAAALHDAIR